MTVANLAQDVLSMFVKELNTYKEEVNKLKGLCMESNLELQTTLKLIRNGKIKQENISGRYYSEGIERYSKVKNSGYIKDGKGIGVWEVLSYFNWIGEVNDKGIPNGFGIMETFLDFGYG